MTFLSTLTEASGYGSEDFSKQLLDFEFISQQVQDSNQGIAKLLINYQQFLDHQPSSVIKNAIKTVYKALDLARFSLSHYPEQLPTQLYGRLVEFGADQPPLQSLLNQIRNYQQLPWLLPLGPSLIPPDSHLITTITRAWIPIKVMAYAWGVNQLIWGDGNGYIYLWDLNTHTLLTKLTSLESQITAIAIATDGKIAVSGYVNGFLCLWDLTNYQLLTVIKAHQWAITALQISGDAQYLISTSADLTIKIWQINTDNCQWQQTLTGHRRQITALNLTSQGEKIISADAEGIVNFWDLSEAELADNLETDLSTIVAMALSQDNQQLAIASDEGIVQVWNLDPKKSILELNVEPEEIIALNFTSDAKKLVTSTENGQIQVWALPTGALETSWNSGNGAIEILIPDREANQFLLASANSLQICNLSALGVNRITEKIQKLKLTSLGDLALITALNSSGPSLQIWDVNQTEVIGNFPHSSRLAQALITPDGQRAISLEINQNFSIFDLTKVKLLQQDSGYSNSPLAVNLSPDGNFALVALADRHLALWDLVNAEKILTLPGHPETDFPVMVALSQRLDRAVSATQDRLKIWDLTTAQALHTVSLKGINKLALTADGLKAIAVNSQSLIIWNLDTVKQELIINWPISPVIAVEINLEGNLAVVLNQDYSLSLWDLTTESVLPPYPSPTAPYQSMTLTRDGQKVLALTRDGTIQLLNLKQRQILASFTPDSQFSCYAISGNGQKLATADCQGQLTFWQLV